MEPLATLAAGAIAKLAFDEFVKAGAGEAAKSTVGGAVELVPCHCRAVRLETK